MITEIIDRSWRIDPWNWDRQYKAISKELRRLTDDQVAEFAISFQRRVAALYRSDIWHGSFLLTEGFMSDDGFYQFTDCVAACPDEIYRKIVQDGDNLIDHPELEGYGEICFWLQAIDLYDKRKKVHKYTQLVTELPAWKEIEHPETKFVPATRAWVSEHLPRLYAKFADEVVWKNEP